MPLDLEVMDAEPVAATPEPVTETPPAAPAASAPPIEGAAVVAAPAAATPAATPEPDRVIPLAAHLEERRALKARIAELEAAAPKPTPAAAPEPVAFMENPEGHIDQRIKAVTDKVTATEAELQSYREQQQIQALVSEAGQAEAVFAKDHPDYEAALDHVRSTRLAQLRLVDSETPEAQLKQVIAREEIAGIAAAKQRGINPAELAYNYAKTLGYRTPEPKPVAAVTANTPAAAAAPATLAAAAADVSAARSLGAGGGGGDSGGGEEESELTAALKQRFRK